MFSFHIARAQMEQGKRVKRTAWPAGEWAREFCITDLGVSDRITEANGFDSKKEPQTNTMRPFYIRRNKHGELIPYTFDMSDVCAHDWFVVENFS